MPAGTARRQIIIRFLRHAWHILVGEMTTKASNLEGKKKLKSNRFKVSYIGMNMVTVTRVDCFVTSHKDFQHEEPKEGAVMATR